MKVKKEYTIINWYYTLLANSKSGNVKRSPKWSNKRGGEKGYEGSKIFWRKKLKKSIKEKGHNATKKLGVCKLLYTQI
jgi:hypothetical protein